MQGLRMRKAVLESPTDRDDCHNTLNEARQPMARSLNTGLDHGSLRHGIMSRNVLGLHSFVAK
jgi:hypothetical protein